LRYSIPNIVLLSKYIFAIFFLIWMILPNLNINLIEHNIKKGIDANVYLYTELEIKKEWSR